MRFSTSGFFMNQFPPTPEYPRSAVSNFFCFQGAPPVLLTPVKKWKKSPIRKLLNILFEHLWLAELT
jgi:hypothetical protein